MAESSYISLPFKSQAGSGFWELQGIAKFSSAGVVLEVESKLLGLVPGEIKEVRIALEDILDARFRKGLFKIGAKIEIRLKSLQKLQAVPSEGGVLKLGVKRRDFELARKAYERLERDLQNLDRALEPSQTSVTSLFEGEEQGDAETLKLRSGDLKTKELN